MKEAYFQSDSEYPIAYDHEVILKFSFIVNEVRKIQKLPLLEKSFVLLKLYVQMAYLLSIMMDPFGTLGLNDPNAHKIDENITLPWSMAKEVDEWTVEVRRKLGDALWKLFFDFHEPLKALLDSRKFYPSPSGGCRSK